MNEPRDLTEAIDRVRVAVADLDWTDQVWGRAMQQLQQNVGQDRAINLPMVHIGEGEYADCRPNDDHKSVVFFVALEPDRSEWDQDRGHTPGRLNRSRRRVALIGWVNFAQLPKWDDGTGFTERIKLDLRNCLINTNGVSKIGDYTDNPASEVFRPFVLTDLDTRFDRWPFAMFRQEFTLHTVETHQPVQPDPLPEPAPMPDPQPDPQPQPDPPPISTD